MEADGLGGPVTCEHPPLRITVRLRTPAALYGWPWIMLDGLLAHLAARRRSPDGYRVLPSQRVLPLEELVGELPLDRAGPVYRASASFFGDAEPALFTIYKRFDTKRLDVFRVRRRRIETAKGPFRSWRVNLLVMPSRTVVFYARGDPDEIRRLLEALPAVGHKRVAGFGIVDSVTVEETGEDCSLACRGVATRPLPVSMLESYEGRLYVGTYRPPYWDRTRTTLLVAPGARVRLRGEYTCGT